MNKLAKTPITDAELEVLRIVLREVRHVLTTGEQLNIIVDPFIKANGCTVGFHYNGAGWTTDVTGIFRKRRKSSRRARVARTK